MTPYAHRHLDTSGKCWAECPVCHEMIPLLERKDFESFTGREYAEHYEAAHRPTGQRPTVTMTRAVVVDINTERTDRRLVPDDGTIGAFLAWMIATEHLSLGVGGVTGPGIFTHTFDADDEPAIRAWFVEHGFEVES